MTAPTPPLDRSLLPADVRKAGPKAEQLYETALSFEGMLDEQLAQSITSTLQSGDDSPDGSTDVALQSLPTAFSQGLLADGGLGIARQLYDSLSAGKQAPTRRLDGGSQVAEVPALPAPERNLIGQPEAGQ
jgi:Rod binding domain-containing protein